MQEVVTNVIIGRNTGGSGDMEALSAADVRTLLNVADGATVGITTDITNIQATFNLTYDSSNYRLTGPGQDVTENNPDLYLVRGQRYRIMHNAGGAHPLQIRLSSGGTAYTDGVTYSNTTYNRTENGNNLEINLQHDAPARLYYQCTVHGGMVGNIFVVGGPQHIVGVLTATSFSGSIAASNVDSGTLGVDRIPSLAASKITSGTLGADRIPSLAASKITSGTFDAGRIPTLNQDTSGTAAVATRVTVTNQAGDSTCNVLFAQSATGDQLPHTNANLTFNSTKGTLTATTFVGNLDLGSSNISSGTHTFTASAGSAVAADNTAIGSCNAIEYTVFVSNSSNIQSQKVLIMDNGTTVYSQEFAVMSNPNLIATFSADVNSGLVRLLATPETGISGSTTIKFTKMIIE